MALRRERVGHRYPAYRYEVGGEKIREFAAATGLGEQACQRDGGALVAPPTFASCFTIARACAVLLADDRLGAHPRLMHAAQEFVLHRPVRAGDVLRCQPRIDDIIVRGPTSLLTLSVACVDERSDEPVVDTRGTLVFPDPQADDRPVRVTGRAPPPPDAGAVPGAEPAAAASRDPVAVGQELPVRVERLDQARLIRYAGASGDFNPLHWDAEFAAAVSPTGGVIAHGMLSLGLVAALVADWAGGAGAVTRLAGTFRAPCPVGARLLCGGRVVALDPERGQATLSVWAELDDGSRVVDGRRSRAVVRLPAG